MAAKLCVALFIACTISAICLRQSSACNLVPSHDGTCFELAATPYITFVTSQYGPTIEGASVNPAGEMFAVNYGTSETTYQLGQIVPDQRLFYSDANRASLFNGIRFSNRDAAYIADKINLRVLKLNLGPGNTVINSEDFCRNNSMIEPNDVALSITGTVFTSGMIWIDDTDDTHGHIWSCRQDGTVQQLEVLGRTNGIELSPDERFLYVSESYNRGGVPYEQKIWRYDVNVIEGTIANKTLFVDFKFVDGTEMFDIDGMKTDINGNLYVARYGGRHIAIFSKEGHLIGKIALNFPNSTNLEFGGPNGTTLYIVGQCALEGRGCVDRIEVVTPGRHWTMLQASSAWSLQGINNYSTGFLLIAYFIYSIFTSM